MGLHAVKILGIKITSDSKKTILEELEKRLSNPGKSGAGSVTIVTPNPEQIVYAKRDKQFADILNRADVAIPDGGGIVWASRVFHPSTRIVRIPGVEFMQDLAAMAKKRGAPIALIGGRGGLAVRTLECLRARYHGLQGWAVEPEQAPIEKIADKIEKTGTRMVFVGLGAPKQEYFIERLRREMSLRDRSDGEAISKISERLPRRFAPRNDKGIVFMSVGGSFDIITGRTPRAPQFMRALGLEWLWRLVREPRRFGRQLALGKFVWLVLRERLFRT